MTKEQREQLYVGGFKIKDGLFMGDQSSIQVKNKRKKSNQKIKKQDQDYINMNKISNIINCSGQQLVVPYSQNIKQLTFNWQETENQVLFEKNTVQKIIDFIKEAEEKGESVLIVSQKGTNRSACATIIYLLYEYKWTLNKCLDFLQNKRSHIKLSTNFQQQLMNQEKLLKNSGLSSVWDLKSNQLSSSDEALISNTYLNSISQNKGVNLYFKNIPKKKLSFSQEKNTNNIQRAIKWSEDNMVSIIENNNKTNSVSSSLTQNNQIKHFVKSMIKGSITYFDKASGTKIQIPEEEEQKQRKKLFLNNQNNSQNNIRNRVSSLDIKKQPAVIQKSNLRSQAQEYLDELIKGI
ncbi:hypothetical protein IMG5_066550 [Ichthyophthirius multifiliis]|uniref:Tyrosine-protein phosphatase domain-containing protein n=1 Tax=Ichthyophthirius multifiliis TaxID=5932 RepID=G0QPC6_ICHMU|nr:hypothetical protein IMG5_066550 [Ichthyophthirius multifiliis]EGR32926.1 hypothetical protein IMG5_066550 [Ichthyophthirius multifiliis]|eukprot:XP_004036912.1 hypothetical protein IMG5_066550 [Ichthyophthirius multifiliis]